MYIERECATLYVYIQLWSETTRENCTKMILLEDPDHKATFVRSNVKGFLCLFHSNEEREVMR